MNRTKTKLALAAAAVIAVAVGGVTLAVTQPPPPKPAAPAVVAAQPAAAPPAAGASDYFLRRDDKARLKRVGMAFHDYIDANADRLPTDITGKDGKPLLSWRVRLLPYLDQEYLYAQFKLDEPWDSDHNKKLLPAAPRVYRGPRAAAEGTTHVQGFVGKGAAFDPTKVLTFPADFPDGSSNTLFAVEAGAAVPWTKPADLPFDRTGPLPNLGGPHADGFTALWGDGMTSWLTRPIDEKAMRLFIDRDDGKTNPSDWYDKPPTVRPLTAREQKKLDNLRKVYATAWEGARKTAAERHRLTVELANLGGVPAFPLLPRV